MVVLIYIFIFEFGEFPEQFLLSLSKVGGCSNVNNDDLISTSCASQLGNPFTGKPKGIARLGTLSDGYTLTTINRWYF